MSDEPGSFLTSQRSLGGYGPLVVGIVLLVLMAAFAPTKAQEVETSGTDAGESAFDFGADGGDDTTTTTTEAGDGSSTTQSTEVTETTAGGSSGQVAADGQGSGIAPVSGVQACPERETQVPGDPYSPPCVAWGGGDNGGATSKGVTGDKILVSYRVLNEKGFQQTLAQLAGASLSDTPETIQNTISAFAQYFNERFEFFGREIEIAFYDGQGSNTNELLGKGRAEAEADAVKVGEEIGSFADLSATSEPYADALADRGVVGFGTPYLSRQWHEERAPFAWSLSTDGTRVSELAAEYANKKLFGKPAVHAGGDLADKSRKFATLAPENSWYQESVNNARRIAQEAGNDPGLNVKYQLDLARMSSQANNIIPKLQSEGVTTIICGCDPVLPVFLSGTANKAGYYPEFIVAGTALTDTDIVGQLWNQQFASHAFGISPLEPFVQPTQTIAYEAFKSVRPDQEPAFSVDLIYYQMYMLAIGIQGAGPVLTPQALSDGLFNYPARSGPLGMWQFGPGDRTAANDVREIYWDPDAVSPYNGQRGSYLPHEPSQRYEFGEIPGGDPLRPQS